MNVDTYDQLRELECRLEGGAELLYAMHFALKRGYGLEDFSPAMYAIHIYLSDLSDQLNELLKKHEGAFA